MSSSASGAGAGPRTRAAPPLVGARELAQDLRRRCGGLGPLLALDHDGTLTPIALTPDAAVLPAGTRAALAALCTRTPVAVLSGRGLEDLVARLGDLPLTLVAEHGLRRRGPDGAVRDLADPPRSDVLARLRRDLAVLLAGRPGWLVEDKGVGVAVHHRLVPADAASALLPRVRALLERAAVAGGGRVQDGHAVLELRAAGADKGEALRAIAAEHAGRHVVMVGDDLTDEAALAVAAELGGTGVLVAGDARPSAATVRLRDPAAVAELLVALALAMDQAPWSDGSSRPVSPGRSGAAGTAGRSRAAAP